MGMNETPAGERIHIGIFGRRNAGEIQPDHALAGRFVGGFPGERDDDRPGKKAMELLPPDPVMLIDTPGLDDEGELGAQRVKKAAGILRQTEFALLVVETGAGSF